MFGLFKKKDAPKTVEDKVVPASKHVSGAQPKGAKLMQFKALDSFYSDKTRSAYVKGQLYTVRTGNRELEKQVREWEKAGKCKIK